MTGKLLITLALVLLAQVCLAQNAQSSAGANFEASAGLNLENLGAQLGAQLGGQLDSGINALQNGASAIGNGLNHIGQHVQGTFHNALAAASAAASRAQEQLAQLAAGLQKTANEAMNAATKHIDEAITTAKQSAAAARQRAQDLGQVTEQCTGEEVDLEAVRARALDLVTGCVKEKFQKAAEIINNISNSASNAMEAATNLNGKISVDCNGLSSITLLRCRASVTSQAGGQLAADVKEIAAAVNNARQLIQTMKLDLEICTAKKAAQAVLDAGKVAVKIAECVRNN